MDATGLSIQRGDIVLVVASGDFGKPRPAVIVQSDLFNETHASVTVCPVTSLLVNAPLFRIPLRPSRANGLARASQVMVDKVQTLRRDRVRQRIGTAGSAAMAGVETALRLWLRL
ncbi:MAG: type II toxin-antitoxin system PemK/MazF family toxin [Burkholderiales bacterium]